MNDVIVKTTDFEIAVAWVTENFMSISKDDLLRLYAFYKLANGMPPQTKQQTTQCQCIQSQRHYAGYSFVK